MTKKCFKLIFTSTFLFAKIGLKCKYFKFTDLSKDKKIKIIIMAPDGSLKPLGNGDVFYVDKLN